MTSATPDPLEPVPDPPLESNLASSDYFGDPTDSCIDQLLSRTPSPMGTVWSGIILAAGCYPIVLGLMMFIWATFTFGFHGVSGEVLGGIVLYAMICFLVGMMYGIIMTVPAYLLTQLLRWSSGGVVSVRGLCGVFGGLTGFLCITGGGLNAIWWSARYNDWVELIFFLFPPLLAVVMGHFGAIWAGYRNRDSGFPFFDPIISTDQKITISFLIKLTTVVAVLTAICKAVGHEGLYVGIAWLIYMVVQIGLLFCDHWLTRWLSRR